MNTVVKLVDMLHAASIVDILPTYLRSLAGFSLREFYRTLEETSKFMKDRIEEHKRTYQKEVTRDFVDAWLKANEADEHAAKLLENGHGGKKKEISDLSDVIQDVVIAGSHSTSIVMHWVVLFLVLYPEEQEKVYQEILEMVGTDRVPSMSDKSKLVHLEAFLLESQRVGTVLPLVAHATGRDTVVSGYDIPANTEVIYNNWTINHDPNVFTDPYKFKPDRWLDQDNCIRKDLTKKFYPFGMGKRACAGESLAKMNLFILTASILQHLKLLQPGKDESHELQPEIKHVVGLLADCKPFLMKAIKR